MKPMIRIIIPTWNNPQFLAPCVQSIITTRVLDDVARLTIVNNGKQPMDEFKAFGIDVIEPGENLGWEGGLKRGVEESDEPFIVFQNDDTHIPPSSSKIYHRMLTHFADEKVGAVGPTTTTAGGIQSIFHRSTPLTEVEASFLIFFTVMVRRSALEAAGGVDTTLPGGDDLDLSIRLRKAGYKLLISPFSFLLHHGFKTGTRVHGDGYAGVKNGWNSREMTDRTNQALIKKHGFKAFTGLSMAPVAVYEPIHAVNDIEGKMVRSCVVGEKVLELGCGGQKTVEFALGVDRVPNGEMIPHLIDIKSVADVVADVTEELPFQDFTRDSVIARHILEHCLDPIKTLRQWNRVIRMGGRLIIAVPDESVTVGIPLNVEHVHAFNAASLRSMAEVCGFKEIGSDYTGNGVSLVSCFEKVEHMPAQREVAHV